MGTDRKNSGIPELLASGTVGPQDKCAGQLAFNLKPNTLNKQIHIFKFIHSFAFEPKPNLNVSVLRFNLGPMHSYMLEGFIQEVFELDTTKSYLRKQVYIGRVMTNKLNQSASIAAFQQKHEKKSRFPFSFCLSNSE